MATAISAPTIDYRAAQQSHHHKILAQLLAQQQSISVQTSSMAGETGNSLGLSAPDLHPSFPTSLSFGSSAPPESHRSSASSSLSSGSSNTYLKSPHMDSLLASQSEPQSWDNLGWGEMTFGMVAQAQANLASNMSHANSFTTDKHAPAAWLAPQQSIDPGYLRQAQTSISIDHYPQPSSMFATIPISAALPQTFAPSPLRSMSPASDEESQSEDDMDDDEDSPAVSADGSDPSFLDGATRRSTRLRKRSDSDFILESPGDIKRGARRLTWTSVNDARQREFEIEVSKREVERLREMKRFEESNGKGNRKERRRLQNRLAQRAFRARSKIQGKEFNEHMGDLESLTVDQADRIDQLTQIVDRLQKENASLKAGRWAAFQGVPHGEMAGLQNGGEPPRKVKVNA